jgi:hypothetical protein
MYSRSDVDADIIPSACFVHQIRANRVPGGQLPIDDMSQGTP